MYRKNMRHVIKENTTMRWRVQGPPGRNANLELMLTLTFVEMPGPRKGVILALPQKIDDGIRLVSFDPQDCMLWGTPPNEGGPNVWLMGGNGVAVEFTEVENLKIPIFSIESVTPGIEATIYFSYLPLELDPEGKGDVEITDDIWLESGKLEVASLRDILDLL